MKYLMYVIFLFSQLNCIGQTIKDFLVNEYRLEDTTISEINEIKTYFENSGKFAYKRTYCYNKKGFITKMVGLDTEGKLSTRMSYLYDNNDNLIQITDEKWNHSLGHSTFITKFIFDSMDLKEIQVVDSEGKIEAKSVVQTENGFPISICSYRGDDSLIGYEIAKYDYEKNEVLIEVYDSQGDLFGKPVDLEVNLSNDGNFIANDAIKNDFGDIIQESKPKCLSCDELVTVKYEYKYDGKKNWTKKLTYKMVGVKKELILKETRRIKYRNEITEG